MCILHSPLGRSYLKLKYRNNPMFSDAKNNYFGEKYGVSENKGCPKNMFWTLKINYFGEKQGVSENKGCPKTWDNYGIIIFSFIYCVK